MSEFGKFKDEAEQYAKDHPQQVHEGEQAAERKLGMGGQQDQGGQQNQGNQQDQSGNDPQGQHAQGDQPGQ